MTTQEKLAYWKDWADRNEQALGDLAARMDEREALYRGERREIAPLTPKDRRKDGSLRKTSHLRNIVAENIESVVNSTIPQPKVTSSVIRLKKRQTPPAEVADEALFFAVVRAAFN